jgi:hypothetical protein
MSCASVLSGTILNEAAMSREEFVESRTNLGCSDRIGYVACCADTVEELASQLRPSGIVVGSELSILDAEGRD